MLAEEGRRHFGVLPFTGTGHLNPMFALCGELKERGHRITFFEKPKIERRVRDCGFDFVPMGSNRNVIKQARKAPAGPAFWSDLLALRFNLRRVMQDLEMYLEESPSAIRETDVDALIISEIALTGPTVAETLGLPYVLVSTSVPHHHGWGFHPWRPGYKLSSSWVSHLESAWLGVSILQMRGPIRIAMDAYRRKMGLGSLKQLESEFPPVAHITQLPECLDPFRRWVQDGVHYTGPWIEESARPAVDFPWSRLDGRPMIYTSLGTTRNVQPAIFRMIAEACQDFDIQLVISLGARFAPETLGELPGDPIVVRYAPQLALLERSKLVITHAGPNTSFEALMAGKPMVAIPLAHDQPAIAARLARLRAAEVLPVMRLSTRSLRVAVAKVLGDASYQKAAAKLQTNLQAIHGTELAANAIEEALGRNAGTYAPRISSLRDAIASSMEQ
ncbi:MAG TPA: glycosyltransferase [Terracidiphilus sp.]|jgi:MGT family glycosyltransferase|nr:glycosyltransferase [Terracidiphilus sp.]